MISFVIPAFNEEANIVRCVQSIVCEAGTIAYEIIVVDNCSMDNTRELALLSGARVVYESRQGITYARQTGAEAARFGLIAFIDADSEVPPGWLDAALAALKGPNVVAASGPVVYRDLPLYKCIVSFGFYCLAKVAHQIRPMLQGGNFILRKEALQRAGGFNTAIDFYGEDTDTAMRLSKVGKVNFDLNMWIHTSARRMQAEGWCATGCRYIANYIWMWATGRPWTAAHHDHR